MFLEGVFRRGRSDRMIPDVYLKFARLLTREPQQIALATFPVFGSQKWLPKDF